MKNKKRRKSLRVALLCGGPSSERGISLNSARSVSDHLAGSDIEIVPLYFDVRRRAFAISNAQLYSNTPLDFDFKLFRNARPLSETRLKKVLLSCDIAFPAMHGEFGEDGGIQKYLERIALPFVGSSAHACAQAFHKWQAKQTMTQAAIDTVPGLCITQKTLRIEELLKRFFSENRLSRAIVKPTSSGSSIGVHSVESVAEAHQAVKTLFKGGAVDVLVEPFCQGTEFTVVVLEGGPKDEAVALPPIEIATDYSRGQIFDYRKKYLPTQQASYSCPPRFSVAVTNRIRSDAARAFRALGLRDMARIDGWVLKSGKIVLSDVNPVSGMEQNSFFFLAGSRIGFSHRGLLRFVLGHACNRAGIAFDPERKSEEAKARTAVRVIFGGSSAERQVSVMSGTNVWLKLRRSSRFDPEPYLLDRKERVWRLPYTFALHHTVEEIEHVCHDARRIVARIKPLRRVITRSLGLNAQHLSETLFVPRSQSIEQFLSRRSFVFLGLHGGIGEDGTLQAELEARGIPFNGTGSASAALCMDKYSSCEVISRLGAPGLRIAPKIRVQRADYLRWLRSASAWWEGVTDALESPTLIVKPVADGCSAGVLRLTNAREMRLYLNAVKNRLVRIPAGTFPEQSNPIEMPARSPEALLFEDFVETDLIEVRHNKLLLKRRNDWIEVTIGVLGRQGAMRAMNPSLTVASGAVLSVEEKFQGGTGINITPPPQPLVRLSAITLAKRHAEAAARALGLAGYARLDCFMHRKRGDLIFIEANTLPALTPSTVLYHQALAEKKPRYPTEFLEHLIDLGMQDRARNR